MALKIQNGHLMGAQNSQNVKILHSIILSNKYSHVIPLKQDSFTNKVFLDKYPVHSISRESYLA